MDQERTIAERDAIGPFDVEVNRAGAMDHESVSIELAHQAEAAEEALNRAGHPPLKFGRRSHFEIGVRNPGSTLFRFVLFTKFAAFVWEARVELNRITRLGTMSRKAGTSM